MRLRTVWSERNVCAQPLANGVVIRGARLSARISEKPRPCGKNCPRAADHAKGRSRKLTCRRDTACNGKSGADVNPAQTDAMARVKHSRTSRVLPAIRLPPGHYHGLDVAGAVLNGTAPRPGHLEQGLRASLPVGRGPPVKVWVASPSRSPRPRGTAHGDPWLDLHIQMGCPAERLCKDPYDEGRLYQTGKPKGQRLPSPGLPGFLSLPIIAVPLSRASGRPGSSVPSALRRSRGSSWSSGCIPSWSRPPG